MQEKTLIDTIREETDAALAELAKFEAGGPKSNVAGAKAKNFLRNLKATIGGTIDDINIKTAARKASGTAETSPVGTTPAPKTTPDVAKAVQTNNGNVPKAAPALAKA